MHISSLHESTHAAIAMSERALHLPADGPAPAPAPSQAPSSAASHARPRPAASVHAAHTVPRHAATLALPSRQYLPSELQSILSQRRSSASAMDVHLRVHDVDGRRSAGRPGGDGLATMTKGRASNVAQQLHPRMVVQLAPGSPILIPPASQDEEAEADEHASAADTRSSFRSFVAAQLHPLHAGIAEDARLAAQEHLENARGRTSKHLEEVLAEAAAMTTPPRTWRFRMGEIIEHHYVQLVVLVLIIADVTAVFGEIMLSHVCGCTAKAKVAERPDLVCEVELDKKHAVEDWEHALHWLSTSILAVFALQQLLLILAYGLRFFRKIFYVVDLVVVVVALVLELAIKRTEGGLLAVVLSWRIVRVIHGFLASAESAEHRMRRLRKDLRKQHTLLVSATGYPATMVRLLGFRNAARTIQKWWRRRHARAVTGVESM